APGVFFLCPGRLMAVTNQLLQGTAAVAFAAENIEQHPVRNLKPGCEALRQRIDEATERLLVPTDEVPFRRLAMERFLSVFGGFFQQLQVLDHVFGRLRHHPTAVIVSFPSGATGDLMKIAPAQNPGFLAIEFAELSEKN